MMNSYYIESFHVTNEHDIKLVNEAVNLSYIDWSLIDEDKAETKEGKDALHFIMMEKYHAEERSCDME